MAIVQTSKTTAPPIATTAEAAAMVSHLHEVMDALLNVVEQETAFVRGGHLSEVSRLESAKSRLALLYIADVTRLRASSSYLEAHEKKLLSDLKLRHTAFHAQLQVNLTVLATAHAVAEGIVRSVSAEVAQKTRPQVYGASGRQVGTRTPPTAPMAVVRSL